MTLSAIVGFLVVCTLLPLYLWNFLGQRNAQRRNDLEFKNQEWRRMCARLENVEKELSESKRHELAWRHQYMATNKELERIRLSIRIRN